MTDPGDQSANPSESVVKIGGYANPSAALKEVGEAFNAWSANLASTSLQMCYALVAANWLVYGSMKAIISSRWSILSLLSVFVALAVNLATSFVMTELHRCRYKYAEDVPDRWVSEFNKYSGTSDPWPYTATIEAVGLVTRLMKLLLPVVGGLFLLVGACAR
jgi:hypothetical protein